jgi:Arc/MetJ-type ribon-helix-helix transcriptional regulator
MNMVCNKYIRKALNMHIRFSEIDANFIKEAIEQGFYLSETELVRDAVIRDAVRRMREATQSQNNNRFKQAVEAGGKSLKNGDTVTFTADTMKEAKQRAIKNLKDGKGYNSNDSIPN